LTQPTAITAGGDLTAPSRGALSRPAPDLPDGRGGVVPASTVHHVALVELSDRFAAIARDHRQLI
jgi:hypothetical protein